MTARKAQRPRLKKNPEIADYVVEYTIYGTDSVQTLFRYFTLRAEAREFARDIAAHRVRVFRMKFVLVSDSPKAGGGK